MQTATQRQGFLDDRKTSLGGSDVAAALGMSKWTTPYQLWLEKTGQAEPVDQTWEMLRGNAMEPALRQHYSNVTGRAVRLPEKKVVNAAYPFMHYNPDGFTDDNRLIELKTTGFNRGAWGDENSDEIPTEYLLQVHAGMLVMGLPVADVCVSIGGNKPRMYNELTADKDLQAMLIDRLGKFWNDNVLGGVPPAPINTDDLKLMYKVMHKNPITATKEIVCHVDSLKDLRVQIKKYEEEKEAVEFTIKSFMADHETLLDAHGIPLITWKQGKGAVRLDGKALKEDKPLVWEEYAVQGDPVRRFLVK